MRAKNFKNGIMMGRDLKNIKLSKTYYKTYMR